MMVTPLRDGMNLVAKEYVAARADSGGALVLSEFAGAAAELRQAFLCNPHDLDAVKDALLRAVNVDPDEARRRMRSCNVHLRATTWRTGRGRFLTELGRTDFGGDMTHLIGVTAREYLTRSCAGGRPHRPGPAAPGGLRLRRHSRAHRARTRPRRNPLPEAVAAVRTLASLPQTTVAVVSGRALRDLAALSRLPSEVHLVGSHGSEFDIGFVERLAPELVAAPQRLHGELRDDRQGPARVYAWRRKPASVAVHTRAASTREVAARPSTRSATARRRGRRCTSPQGKEVIELSVVATHKGTAVDALRTQLSASAVLFIGDDVTDENAFAHLHGPDIGIKVGPGDDRGRLPRRRPDRGVAACWRCCWRPGGTGCSASGRCRSSGTRCWPTAAPSPSLTPDATVTWLCHPRPDSGAVFADLLGGSPAGHFTVRPERGGIPLGPALPAAAR